MRAESVQNLLYSDGIAGREAKHRYNSLCVYFFMSFFSKASDSVVCNMSRLQNIVNLGASFYFDGKMIQKKIEDDADTTHIPSFDEVRRDVCYRLFYYIH